MLHSLLDSYGMIEKPLHISLTSSLSVSSVIRQKFLDDFNSIEAGKLNQVMVEDIICLNNDDGSRSFIALKLDQAAQKFFSSIQSTVGMILAGSNIRDTLRKVSDDPLSVLTNLDSIVSYIYRLVNYSTTRAPFAGRTSYSGSAI